ncbi:L,D-transpeptidase family protein [Flavobacterium sp.]|uniref:L,D-transpeptidase family protein n=1 Tax=Flavobacterium sp. TaxID=239 RepID=UPI002616B2C2|nr:L,D-transpeptidase family protein [Flavobacterium sp.]
MNKFYVFIILVSLSGCKRSNPNDSFSNASFIDISFFNRDKIKIDSMLINASKDEDFKSFYKKYNYEVAWTNKEHRDFLINEIGVATNEGLESKDYNHQILKSFELKYEELPDSTIVKYDLLLTSSAQLYVNHISKGKLNPKKLYKDWDLKEKKVNVNEILFDCIDNNNFDQAIENCKPSHIIYKKLKNCLALLKQFPEETTYNLIDLKERIIPNKKNKYIPIIKKRLMYWGDMIEKDTILSTLYDKKTQDAVKIFQTRHGLRPDAVIGRSTIDALNYSRNQRIEQVVVNMERWRWFANDFGNHYLLINIPDYSIVAVKEKDTTQIQKIVVGKETRPTPILESKISNINLNPNWTVPPTILKEDIYPEAEKDRGVFRKKGLKIFDRKNNEINPHTWKKEDANKYKYVQDPGRNNSLGSMKINFPNKYSVYLHDTNHRDYFAFSYRSLSSGCVRLEKPLEMASYIINDTTKWSYKRIKDTTDIKYYYKLQKAKQKQLDKLNAKLLAKNPNYIIEKKPQPKPELKTIVVKINEDIYIHQLYWTAWENNGVLNFREDIYCLDANLYSKLRY